MTVALALSLSLWTALAFISGAATSMLAGFIGMEAATRSSSRIKAKRFVPAGCVAGLSVHRVKPLPVERSERLGVSRGDRLCE